MTSAPADPRSAWDLPGFGGLPPVERLSDSVTRVLAPNPSHMTLDGTNTYIVGSAGSGAMFVIDPGPPDPVHLGRVQAALAASDAECAAILVTHHHLDHSEAALAWGTRLGATVWASSAEVAGPDGRLLSPGDPISAGGFSIETVPTPGHTADHVSFRLPDASVLCGDHILGRGTSVVAWPEGDLVAYLESLRRVRDLGPSVLYPGHGPHLGENPGAVVDYYLEHRAWREQAILDALDHNPGLSQAPNQLVEILYAEVDPRLWPAAELSTRAGLVKLSEEGRLPAGSRLPLDASAPDRGGGNGS